MPQATNEKEVNMQAPYQPLVTGQPTPLSIPLTQAGLPPAWRDPSLPLSAPIKR